MKKASKNVGLQKPREENVSGLLNCSTLRMLLTWWLDLAMRESMLFFIIFKGRSYCGKVSVTKFTVLRHTAQWG